MITQVTYQRVYRIGQYESERLEATATAENGDAQAAFDEARGAVEAYYATICEDRQSQPVPQHTGATYDAPASDNQRNYIATLQDKLAWNSEQMGVYASEQGVDLVAMTKRQASTFIDGLKRLAEKAATENGIVKWAERVVTPANTTEDLPF